MIFGYRRNAGGKRYGKNGKGDGVFFALRLTAASEARPKRCADCFRKPTGKGRRDSAQQSFPHSKNVFAVGMPVKKDICAREPLCEKQRGEQHDSENRFMQ